MNEHRKISQRDSLGRIAVEHGGYGTPEYEAWRGMIKRCTYPSNPSYGRYGARGIGICERWRDSFKNFLIDMGRRPSQDFSLGRINNDIGYRPDNCRWETRTQQQSNRSSVYFVSVNGTPRPLSHCAQEFGIARSTLRQRLLSGWSVNDALNRPVDRRRSSK